jgi:hypothetical protein
MVDRRRRARGVASEMHHFLFNECSLGVNIL